MSTFVWILTTTVFLLLLAIFAFFSYLRIKKPHSATMSAEQARLDKKIKKNEVPILIAASGSGNGKFGWLKTQPSHRIWTILLIIAGAVVLYFGMCSQKLETPSMENIWSWSWNHWLWILVFAGIMWLIIARVASGMTKILCGFVILALILVFVIAPIGSRVSSHHPEHEQQKPVKAMTLSMQANSDSAWIRADDHVGYKASFTGNGFITHCILSDGSEGTIGDEVHPCSGPIVWLYVHDTTGRANSVTYEFVR